MGIPGWKRKIKGEEQALPVRLSPGVSRGCGASKDLRLIQLPDRPPLKNRRE